MPTEKNFKRLVRARMSKTGESYTAARAQLGATGPNRGDALRLGIAHHFGWAVAVTATPDHVVVDRRRIEMLEPGLPEAPIHHRGGAHEMHRGPEPLDDVALGALVLEVRAAAARTAGAELDRLAAEVAGRIVSIGLRSWPKDFPTDIAAQRRVPYEARADSVMYLQVLAELADARGWRVNWYDAKNVERDATALLGDRAVEVLQGPRTTLGPPWSKDHRMALAATIVGS